MDYKEKYEMALEGIQEILSGGEDSIKMSRLQLRLQGIFPELKEESENERIRKALIYHYQGDGCICTNEYRIDYKEIRAWLEKQGVQKSSNKVEPKFKVGDWTVSNLDKKARQISEVHFDEYNSYYVVDGKSVNLEEYDRLHHLWTIADAKDGDVLANNNGWVGVFKFLHSDDFTVYYFITRNMSFYSEFCVYDTLDPLFYHIHPATKEQRELLFQKMKEAGYEWDAKKKELKKIEQKTAWSERDENVTDIILSQLRSDNFSGVLGKSLLKAAESWLNSLKGRMQPKSEWSEEDERLLDNCISLIEDIDCTKEEQNWLKSLKNRGLE
jgi:hypothetical protein